MIEGYMNIKEAASRWEISVRRIQVLCSEGRIDGAAKLGREWAIPIDAVKPSDNRVTTGKYKGWRNNKLDQEKESTGETK